MIGSLCVGVVVLTAWRILNWVWFKPKKLEKILRDQGFKGNSYRLLYGDIKQLAAAKKQARFNPINPSDDFLPRAAPTVFTAISQHGNFYYLFLHHEFNSKSAT